MPNEVEIPERCPLCHFVGSVTLEKSVKGESTVLVFYCRRCSAQWPVTLGEKAPDRRTAVFDRRKTSRGGRRRRSASRE
jgi:hypothetical protein